MEFDRFATVCNLRLQGTLVMLIALLGCIASPGAAATDVYLSFSSGSFGQGTLIRSGNECLIITPKHVVIDDRGIPESGAIRVIYSDRSEAEADLHKAFDNDLALLRLREQPIAGCETAPFETVAVKQILTENTQAVVEHKSFEGGSNYTHLAIVRQDVYGDILVTPMLEGDSLEQGFSGGVLYVDNKPVGMLTNVDHGVGQAIRSDAIMATLSTFLAASFSAKSVFLDLDDDSQFLEPLLVQQTASAGLPLVQTASSAARTLQVSTQEFRMDESTGPVVRYESTIKVTDSLGRELLSQQLKASGNSFIAMDKAVINARKNLSDTFLDAALFDNLP